MQNHRFTVCRADFLLPLAPPDRTLRIRDGYVLAEGETIKAVGPYTDEVGQRLLSELGPAMRIVGARQPETPGDAGSSGPIPRLRGVLLPAFVKAHGHDHEQPIIGVAKDVLREGAQPPLPLQAN